MKFRKIITAAILLVTFQGHAQKIETYKFGAQILIKGIETLKVGDSLPDFIIPKIINNTKSKVRSSDFRDQLLIIDFWSTNCSPCVKELPRLGSLQQQFGARIKILPVTFGKKKDILVFWKLNKYTKKIKLPTVVEDMVLSSYFRWRALGLHAWVYKGKVIALTNPEYVNAQNINHILSGNLPDWPVRDDFYMYDNSRPLFDVNKSQVDLSPSLIRYAAISDYKKIKVNAAENDREVGIVRDQIKKTVRAYFLNRSIFDAFIINWVRAAKADKLIKPAIDLQPNQIVWEVSNPSRYRYQGNKDNEQEWIRKNSICFESLNPDTGQTDQEAYLSVISDLNHLLKLNVRWEKRKEKIWVLECSSNSGKFNTAVTNANTFTISELINHLNNQAANPYVFNETGDKENGVMNLNINSWTDLNAIKTALESHGLLLREEERMVDKLVFAEHANLRISY